MITEPQQFPDIPSTFLEGCSYTVVSTAILHSCSRAYRQRCQPNCEVIHGITTSSIQLQAHNWKYIRSRQTAPPTGKETNGCLLGPTGLVKKIHKKKRLFKKKGIFHSLTALKITYVIYSLQEEPH